MNREILSERMAGAVGDSELIVSIMERRDLEAMAVRGVKLFDRRIEPHALGGVDSIANRGWLSAADGSTAGVEIENLQAIASERVHRAAVVLRLFTGQCFFGVTSVAPAAAKNPSVITDPGDYGDGEERNQSAELRDESAGVTHNIRLTRGGFEQAVDGFNKAFERKRLGER